MTEYPDTIVVIDMEGVEWELDWITDEDDPDDTLTCEMCGEGIITGYGTHLGAGGWIAWCTEDIPVVFKAPEA
jgi:hypothetical protein